jgi:hypothetical protein
MISAARSGGSGSLLLVAILAMIQNPGSEHIRFSSRIYLLIFAIILIPSLLSYLYIITHDIGLKPPESNANTDENNNSIELSESVNPIQKEKNLESDSNDDKDINTHIKSLFSSSSKYSPATNGSDDKTPLDFIGRYVADLIVKNILEGRLSPEKLPWAQYLIPYMLTVAILNFNTWGIMPGILPLSLDNTTSGGNGSFNLSVAYQVEAFFFLFGDLSTAKITFSFSYGLLLFLIFSFVIYCAAIDSSNDSYRNSAAGPILIILFSFSRFIESHMITMTYRTIATRFPPHLREEATRAIALTDQISTALGSIILSLSISL